jgi:hypothetical protein
MIKCRKNGVYVTGCTQWIGSNPIGECEICVLKGDISETHGKRKGVAESIRRNMQRPIKSKGNIVKRVSIRKVRPYFKGGLRNGKKDRRDSTG